MAGNVRNSWSVSSVVLVLSLAVVLTRESAGYAVDTDYEYGVVIDAGSTGSRIRVFRWPRRTSEDSVPEATEISKKKVTPGISSFAENLEGIEPYLLELVEQANQDVPEQAHAATPFFFMATAGMRLLEEQTSNDIMDEVNRILSNPAINNFQYDELNTRILSGEEEGAFAWVALNYLKGHFTDESVEYAGVLELGGASTQIAFLPEGSVLANKFDVEIGGQEYHLYVHSYLYYGQEYTTTWSNEYLARENPDLNTINHPCVLRDDIKTEVVYGRTIEFIGTGDATECEEIVDEFVYTAPPYRCHPKPCAIGPVYQPSIPEDRNFYAIGAFEYPIDAFNIEPENETITPEMILIGARDYCALDFAAAKAQSGEKDDFVSSNCIVGLYMHSLLTKAYGFDEDSGQIKYTSKIRDQKVTWAMGAIIYEVSKRDIPSPETGELRGAAADSISHHFLITHHHHQHHHHQAAASLATFTITIVFTLSSLLTRCS